ncbi:hypothetical protein GCM10009591_15530 [Brachybacterium tyrofermentans]
MEPGLGAVTAVLTGVLRGDIDDLRDGTGRDGMVRCGAVRCGAVRDGAGQDRTGQGGTGCERGAADDGWCRRSRWIDRVEAAHESVLERSVGRRAALTETMKLNTSTDVKGFSVLQCGHGICGRSSGDILWRPDPTRPGAPE